MILDPGANLLKLHAGASFRSSEGHRPWECLGPTPGRPSRHRRRTRCRPMPASNRRRAHSYGGASGGNAECARWSSRSASFTTRARCPAGPGRIRDLCHVGLVGLVRSTGEELQSGQLHIGQALPSELPAVRWDSAWSRTSWSHAVVRASRGTAVATRSTCAMTGSPKRSCWPTWLLRANSCAVAYSIASPRLSMRS